MAFRIIFSIGILFSVLFLPFWFSLVLGVGGMLYFRLYLEAPILMLLSDSLYGVQEVRYFGFMFVSLLLCTILFLVVEFLKGKLKFYQYIKY